MPPLTSQQSEFIVSLLHRTGAELLRIQGQSVVVSVDRENEFANDPQIHTDADLWADEQIRQGLHEITTYPVCSEEGSQLRFEGDYSWIIDPIDGSAQYHRRLPYFAISVALWSNTVRAPVWGAVHAPALDLTYIGKSGDGATCNGMPIHAASTEHFDDLFVSISAYRSFERVGRVDLFRDLVTVLKQVRQFGCPSLDLCFVADGRLDARVVAGFEIWDVAAGHIIGSEAGAHFRSAESGELAGTESDVALVASDQACSLICDRLRSSRSQ
jgi:myo-inositol-1(or 4)-monophosphatase